MSTRVYAYRAAEPTEGLEIVREQLRLAHRYSNRLVELELDRRRAVDEAVAECAPALADVESALLALEAELEAEAEAEKRRRVTDRNKKTPPETRERLRELRARRKELRAQRKEIRATAFAADEWQERQAEINNAHRAAGKRARAECGVYWGTYLQIEDGAKSHRRGAPPRFRRWRGEGRVAVQLQGGLSAEELESGTDRRLQLGRRPDGVWVPGTRRPRKLGDAIVRLRVGSQGRDPVWATIPIRLHRPLPDGAAIKWAWLLLRRVGTKERWSVQFVVDVPDVHGPRRPARVGVDVGWRVLDRGLRVAAWSGSDGREGEVVLPRWWLDESRRVERIRGHRDKLLDEAKAAAAEALAELGAAAPEWAREPQPPRERSLISTMRQWRSAARLAALTLRWREEVTGEWPPALRDLEAWRKRDKHLLEYEAQLRDQLQRSRLDLYRRAAASLSQRYGLALVEAIDLRSLQAQVLGEESQEAVRHHMRDAACSILLGALGQRVELQRVDPAYTSAACSECGVIAPVPSPALLVTCGGCGVVADQDVRASRNLLAASGEAVQWDRPPLAPTERETYDSCGPNRAQRRAADRRALEVGR